MIYDTPDEENAPISHNRFIGPETITGERSHVFGSQNPIQPALFG
jgi:hypothetical protein